MIVLSIGLGVLLLLVAVWLLAELWGYPAFFSDSLPVIRKGFSLANPFRITQKRQELNPFAALLLLEQIRKLEAEGAYQEALTRFQQATLPKPQEGAELATQVAILRIAAHCYEQQAQWQKASTCYQQAIRYGQWIGHPVQELALRQSFCQQQVPSTQSVSRPEYKNQPVAGALPNRFLGTLPLSPGLESKPGTA